MAVVWKFKDVKLWSADVLQGTNARKLRNVIMWCLDVVQGTDAKKLRNVMMWCLDVVQHISMYVQLDVTMSGQTRLVGPIITTSSVGDISRDCEVVDVNDEVSDSLDGMTKTWCDDGSLSDCLFFELTEIFGIGLISHCGVMIFYLFRRSKVYIGTVSTVG